MLFKMHTRPVVVLLSIIAGIALGYDLESPIYSFLKLQKWCWDNESSSSSSPVDTEESVIRDYMLGTQRLIDALPNLKCSLKNPTGTLHTSKTRDVRVGMFKGDKVLQHQY